MVYLAVASPGSFTEQKDFAQRLKTPKHSVVAGNGSENWGLWHKQATGLESDSRNKRGDTLLLVTRGVSWSTIRHQVGHVDARVLFVRNGNP